MKKGFAFISALVASFLLWGCTMYTSPPPALSLQYYTYNIYVGESLVINYAPPYAWPVFSSSDPVIATVTPQGLLTGQLVGSTYVTAYDNYYGGTSCNVNVVPRYNYYKEPLVGYNVTKTDVKRYEGRRLWAEGADYLRYYGENSFVTDVIYYFDGSGFELKANVYIPHSSANDRALYDFLYERYYIDTSDGYFWSPLGGVNGYYYYDEGELVVEYYPM